ncbi:hypothetical protein GGU11DRAFT_555733 [Lentinula aff. detonsa]|nr:hypothetical protein GGU11DRAFT_555733 [Lentinula aff. detonsa]
MSFTGQILLSSTPNVVLSYLDSGPPKSSESSYETIILIHGNSFGNAIFKRLLPFNTQYNIRIIAPSRRGFPGSTALSEEERNFFIDDKDDDDSALNARKEQILELRGVEILQFIDGIIQRLGIPPIQNHDDNNNAEEFRKGGIALIGWSLGTTFTLAAMANTDSPLISEEMRERIGKHLRTHVMLEPALTSIGLPLPPSAWFPLRDPTIPLPSRAPLFTHLVTGYFSYSKDALTNRDLDTVLGTIVPDISRVPTIYTFTEAEHAEIVILTPESSIDLYFSKALRRQLRNAYLKVCFDGQLKTGPALKNMRNVIWEVLGDRSYSLVWPTLWEMEDDDEKHGEGENGRLFKFVVVDGVNHFMHWDEPEKTMKVFRNILDAS